MYIQSRGHPTGVGKLTAQELSVFYKMFLDDKYSDHVSYSR